MPLDRPVDQGSVNPASTAARSACRPWARPTNGRRSLAAARAQPGFGPFPAALSYEEAARAVLGAAADEHLARLRGLLCAHPLTEAGAVARGARGRPR